MERTILILIDALGYDLAERHHFHPAGLAGRVRLRTVLGFSQAALTSIFTGLQPDEHGLWMMYSFSSGGSPFSFLGMLPAGVSLDRLWLRRLVTWKLERIDRISSYYSLYRIPRDVIRHLDLPARRSIFLPGGAGASATMIDEISRRGVPIFVRDYRTPEEDAFAELEREVRRGGAGFSLLYTAGLDAELHRFGSGDKRIGEHLAWYRERIETIHSLAPNARIVVMGDHGMCDVVRHIDVMAKVEALGLAVPEDYVPFYDSTMARFRIHSERARSRLEDCLAGLPSGRLLGEDDRERLRIGITDGRFGDIIFLADPGVIILPSYMSTDPVRGMHGYHPDSAGMFSVMLTNDADVEGEWTICDIAPWLVPGFQRAGGGERV